MEERNSREHLSALMDGELDAEPARFLLRRMEREPELARHWSRWHLIRACLAERAPSSLHSDPWRIAEPSSDDVFVARVMSSLRAQQPRRHWARYIGGGAIAASVAAAALMLSVPQTTSTDGGIAGGSDRTVRALASSIPAAPGVSRIAAAPVSRTSTAPWLDRQPMFLAARPDATGLGALSGNYLQQAAYAPDALSATAPMLLSDPQQRFNGVPYMILLVPDQKASAQPQPH